MYLNLLIIIITITFSCSVPIKVLQELFCINCKKFIQEAKHDRICDPNNKYTNSLLETLDFIRCSNVKKCYEMCNKKWKFYNNKY